MDRFWSKVDRRGRRECWLWTGGTVGNSNARLRYGVFWYKGGPERAHRVAWELANGRLIPKDLVVMHACDEPLCCNPKHLVLGTRQANNHDRDVKGRQRTTRGMAHPLAKLTDHDVRAIRSSTLSHRALARQYGVAPSLIARVVRRESWPHVD